MASSVFRALTLALALPVVAGACASDVLAPLDPPTLDAAMADLAHPALDWASAWFSGAGLVAPAITPTSCTFDAASQFFVCTPLTADGLALKQRFSLLDANGNTQSAFDPKTTTAVHLENGVSGTWSPSSRMPLGDTLFVDCKQVLDLTGLGTRQHTINGTSLTLTTLHSTRYSTPPLPMEYKTTIADLVLPVSVPRASLPWPASGTLDVRMRNVDANGNTSNAFIATARFEGTTIVTLTFTVPGGTRTCRINMSLTPPDQIGCEHGEN